MLFCHSSLFLMMKTKLCSFRVLFSGYPISGQSDIRPIRYSANETGYPAEYRIWKWLYGWPDIQFIPMWNKLRMYLPYACDLNDFSGWCDSSWQHSSQQLDKPWKRILSFYNFKRGKKKWSWNISHINRFIPGPYKKQYFPPKDIPFFLPTYTCTKTFYIKCKCSSKLFTI